uniref:E2F-associated phosphoprotein n=1 Tax=Caenorhabditis japonica TaxID=281687 RepID=A0A8R1DZI5_CAEJA
MINDDEAFDDQHDAVADEVTGATMRRLAFEKMDDDYYLGGAVGDEVFDSDDEVSSDDEVKTHLRKLAGIEKEVTKDAFGRRRRRSEFEDDMDDELDRSITDYATKHLGVTPKVVEITDDSEEMEQKKAEKPKEVVENPEYEEECRKADDEWKCQTDQVEQKMAALELLPYDVDLTDSEVDPEMPAAVLKDKSGQAIKLVYSCKKGERFDVEDRKRRQKERRMRISASRLPEKVRREKMIKTVVDTYSTNESKPEKKTYEENAQTLQPLSSILKKSTPSKRVRVREEEEEEKMQTDDGVKLKAEKESEAEAETNPIKRAAMERLKEIEKNDELLYDDQEDEDNEKWVKEHRKIARGEDGPDGGADGVLSCPGCMVELTRDCQRHEIYKTQYRAMFVSNCHLDAQKMTVEKTGKDRRRERQKARKSGKKADGPVLPDDSDLYTPVKCASCATLVAMMDSDEVYHFFNVLAGYS